MVAEARSSFACVQPSRVYRLLGPRLAAGRPTSANVHAGLEQPSTEIPEISFIIVSKDEPLLEQTLAAVSAQADLLDEPTEVIVVDASNGRLDSVRAAQPHAQWLDFRPPAGVRVSIAHQRNVGIRHARGDITVFTDSGCLPAADWAHTLLEPILSGNEDVTVGRTIGRGKLDMYDANGTSPSAYLVECPTINLAFRRSAFDTVGGFDESFEYGSDVDFSWRLLDAGFRLRSVPEAVVSADWGSRRRQVRRAWAYGRARARLYTKHPARLRTAWRRDPVPFAYALFLLGLPLTRVFAPFPALLVIPALRNRRTGAVLTVVDHLVQGAGFLRELVGR
jgi:cellulose synthase/poly-beta-1,6-N-acetylglucosamine synthase-like glycosyltransferase